MQRTPTLRHPDLLSTTPITQVYRGLYILVTFVIWSRRGTVAQECNCNATVMGSMPTRVNKLLFINIFISSNSKSAALNFRIQHAMLLKFGENWKMECLNTRSFLHTLLYAAYIVKKIIKSYFTFIYVTNALQNKS